MLLRSALFAASLAAAPAAPVISYDPDINFSHYRNYDFAFVNTPANIDPTLFRQVRVAIERSLRAHGYSQSRPGDFAVAFTVGPRAKMHASDFGNYRLLL